MLASFQKRIAEKLEVKPGEEMIKAIESAEAVNARIVMADRDIRVTLLRTWRIMGLWSRAKILFQLILSMAGGLDEISAEDVEKMKQTDILETLLADVGKAFPVLRNVLIDERDRYLSHKIKTAPGKKIVAVVGAGHVPGIRKYWDSDADVSALEEIPPPGKLVGILKWLFPSAILLLFVLGFFWGGAKAGKEMIVWWVLAHGILAGIGSIAAMAHPLTILSSVMVAPLTSLNPMIAAGWVSGLVEAFLRQPKVWDFENLSDDVMSVKGFWKNKVTRILLVVVFTNMGSAAGTYMAIPMMVRAMG
jgi:pheromone shutdown-related protein TraB